MQESNRRRRWLRIVLPAAAVTALVPFVLPSTAGASVQSSGTGDAQGTFASATSGQPAAAQLARAEANQQVLDSIAGQITEGLSESARARIAGFTEVDVDPDRNHLTLYWKGTPPARVRRILAHLPHGVTAEVDAARYSKADLHAAREKLLRNGELMSFRVAGIAAPLRITSVGPATDGSGLQIGYDEQRGNLPQDITRFASPAAGKDELSQVAAVTARLTGIHTTVVRQPLSEDLSSRQHDSSPWTGAAALKTPGGGICSSSFSVKNAKGQDMLTTAYHCGGGNGRWSTWWGGAFIGTTDRTQESASDDVLGIQLASQRARGYLYDGPASETDGYAKPVSGWGHNNVGDYVCTDGANGGVHCGVRIAETDIGVTGANGVYRPDADLAYATSATPGGAAAVNGDSGGPVFATVNNHTADEARGTITALDRTITCPASLNPNTVLDGHHRTPWCLAGVYFVPIFQTLQDMHWTLVTR
jgi:hypothetical protein